MINFRDFMYGVASVFTYRSEQEYNGRTWTIKSDFVPDTYYDDTKERVTSYPIGYLKLVSFIPQINHMKIYNSLTQFDTVNHTAVIKNPSVPTAFMFNYHLQAEDFDQYFVALNAAFNAFDYYPDLSWINFTVNEVDYKFRVKIYDVRQLGDLERREFFHGVIPFEVTADIQYVENEPQEYITEWGIILSMDCEDDGAAIRIEGIYDE